MHEKERSVKKQLQTSKKEDEDEREEEELKFARLISFLVRK